MPASRFPPAQSLGFQAHEQWQVYGTELVRQAVEAAQAEGFPLLGKPEGERCGSCRGRLSVNAALPLLYAAARLGFGWGARPLASLYALSCGVRHTRADTSPSSAARMENVFVAMHSMSACFYPAAPMKHCAGAVMMAAVVDGSNCTVGMQQTEQFCFGLAAQLCPPALCRCIGSTACLPRCWHPAGSRRGGRAPPAPAHPGRPGWPDAHGARRLDRRPPGAAGRAVWGQVTSGLGA